MGETEAGKGDMQLKRGSGEWGTLVEGQRGRCRMRRGAHGVSRIDTPDW
jgi:hypothetical protein